MKKIIKFVCIMLVLTLCIGCGKSKEETFACNYINTREGNQYTIKATVDVMNDKVNNTTAVIEYKDEKLAKQMCEIDKVAEDGANVICEGKIITIKEFDKSIAKSLQKDSLTKEEIVNYFKDRHYTCEEK